MSVIRLNISVNELQISSNKLDISVIQVFRRALLQRYIPEIAAGRRDMTASDIRK